MRAILVGTLIAALASTLSMPAVALSTLSETTEATTTETDGPAASEPSYLEKPVLRSINEGIRQNREYRRMFHDLSEERGPNSWPATGLRFAYRTVWKFQMAFVSCDQRNQP